jgi:hypothetical protein
VLLGRMGEVTDQAVAKVRVGCAERAHKGDRPNSLIGMIDPRTLLVTGVEVVTG